MKKTFLVGLFIIVCYVFSSCSSDDSLLYDLPHYNHKEVYAEGVRDFIIYGKYSYDNLTEKDFENTRFSVVNEEKLAEIEDYTDHFEEWVSVCDQDSEICKEYDFDKASLNIGDYFYIENKYSEETYLYYHSFTVYYFDIEKQIMYYFRCKS